MNPEKKDLSFHEIYKLFLQDLRSQLALYTQALMDLDKPDFIDLHYTLLTRITHSLIASSKVVQFNALQLFIRSFETFLTFLKEKRKKLGSRDKELIKTIYDLLKEINQVPENDLSSFHRKKGRRISKNH